MLPLLITVFNSTPITINHSPVVSRIEVFCALFCAASVDTVLRVPAEAGPAGRRQEFRRAIP
jgi:hypothetical protein